MEDLGFSQSWLLVDARSARPLPNWDGVHQVCNPERAITYMRVGPHDYRWQFQLRPDDSVAEMSRPDVVHRLIAPWLGGTDPRQLYIVRQTVYTFKGLVARTWRRGRVFILGDAAHLAPPFLGQGLCAGIRDAANLTWKLALVLQGVADERLLDSYEAERRRHARRMVQTSIAIGRVMSAGPAGSAVVRGVLGRAASLPAVNGFIARSPCPPLRPGALVRPSRGFPGHRLQLSGRLSPQPTVTTAAGKDVALDEVLGDGFAILAHGTSWTAGLGAGSSARLTAGITAGIDEDTRAFFARLGTRYIGIVPAGSPLPVASDHIAASGDVEFVGDTSGVLCRWLSRGRAAAVVLRPDRTVFAAGRRVEPARWRRELEAAGVGCQPRRLIDDIGSKVGDGKACQIYGW
jgi:3-(3-hydroxy-phenyl)propionate hydroxylase